MSRFTKTILKTGTYHSPDGVVEVTPERLKHWQTQFKAMQQAKQVIPVGWDHADDESALQPISLSSYKKKRSARDTIGRLVDFAVKEDGSAEITLDIRDPRAREQAERNNVYVSPVIFDSWKDGHGNEYRDVITHVDFVNHPVDHSQGPFEPAGGGRVACALRMGLSKPYRMAETPMDDNGKKDDNGTKTADTKLKDVLEALEKMDIVLSDDTNEENFLEHLHQALLTAAAHRGEDHDDEPVTVASDDAGYATMSLEAKAAFAFAERTHREAIKNRLDALLKTGRCTPKEHKEKASAIGSVKLSLDAKGQPAPSRLEEWITSREELPEGACWDPARRTKMSQVVDPPARFSLEPEITDEEAERIAKQVNGLQ